MATDRPVHELTVLEIVSVEFHSILEDMAVHRRVVVLVDSKHVSATLPCGHATSVAQVIVSRTIGNSKRVRHGSAADLVLRGSLTGEGATRQLPVRGMALVRLRHRDLDSG